MSTLNLQVRHLAARDSFEALTALLHRMRLPYLRNAAPDVLATARAQRWDPAETLRVLLDAVQGQLCAAVNQAWQSALGSAQCGLTVSGFNLGFGGFGGGVMCPRLSFGGGGPPIGSIGTGANTTGSLYVNGSPLPPSGYTLPTTGR